MRIFISFSTRDRKKAHNIIDRLKEVGHEIVTDSSQIKSGDNISKRVYESLQEADAILALVSRNSLQSEGVRTELTALAFRQISKQQQRIVPILLDDTSAPSYLSEYPCLDLFHDFDAGLNLLVNLLSETSEAAFSDRKREFGKPRQPRYDSQILNLQHELRSGRLTLMCGAGVSVGAGIPNWKELLVDMLGRMMERIAENHAINLDSAKGREFQERYGESALIVGKYLKNNLGKDFGSELREALYADDPRGCALVDAIVSLARPQRDGKPLDSIITFNFDGLIEENLNKANIGNRAIYTEAVKHNTNELPIYHVHGYLPRKGKISPTQELVFSEDAYHNHFTDPFSWSNLVQLSKLSQNTCLLIGLSMTDPNLRRLLDVSRRKNPIKALTHTIIKKTPTFTGKTDTIDDLARLLEEQDANALGLNVIWVDDFHEIPPLLRKIAG